MVGLKPPSALSTHIAMCLVCSRYACSSTSDMPHAHLPVAQQQINEILGPYNVAKQISDSKGDIAHLIADVNFRDISTWHELLDSVNRIKENIITRMMH